MSRLPCIAPLRSWSALSVFAVAAVGQGGVWIDRNASPAAGCSGALLGFDRARGETVWFGNQGCHLGSTLQLRLTNLPPAFVNVPLGFVGFDATSWNGIPLPVSLTPLGFTGCDVLLAPVRSDGLTNTNGIANWNVALPMNALALGIDVYFQGAVLVPGWNPAGFVFSNGGHAVVGSP